jgi:hypothetical protein
MTGTRKTTIPMPEDLKAENKMWVGLKVRKYFGKHGWHVGKWEPWFVEARQCSENAAKMKKFCLPQPNLGPR